MRPILLDTNAYVAFKRGDQQMIEIIQQANTLSISSIMLGELLAGFDGGTKSKKNRADLQMFMKSSRIRLLAVTSDTANFFSQIYVSLRKKGTPIPTNDMWIAAQALEHGCVVCTFEKNFKFIDGLVAGKKLVELVV